MNPQGQFMNRPCGWLNLSFSKSQIFFPHVALTRLDAACYLRMRFFSA
jgi:hypothetical protein